MLGLKSNAFAYEGRFLLACLSTGFSPKILLLSDSPLVLGAQLRSLKNTEDCIGCCLTDSEAIDILRLNKPGLVCISGYSSNLSFQNVIDYVSESCPHSRVLVFVKNLNIAFMPQSADAIIAEADLALPENPILQGLMALVSNTI